MSHDLLYKNENNSDSESEGDNIPPVRSLGLGLDLGDDCVYNVKGNRLDLQGQSAGNTSECSTSTREVNTRREDNPFSFKQFLRDSSNSSKNYQSLGARPKVYRDNRDNTKPKQTSPPETLKKTSQTPRSSEFSSALPDFVQDHLVIEQCYLGNRTCSSPTYDLDLPNFTTSDKINGVSNARSSPVGEPTLGPIPLDLPGLGLSIGNSFPLDLPLAANASAGEPSRVTPVSEVGNSKSLPDFLTDGPVRTGNDNTLISSPELPAGSAEVHVDASSRCRRCVELRVELATARQRTTRAEDEAEKNSRRATVAENTVAKLKQELKSLKAQIGQLKAENEALRVNEGAVGGGSRSWNKPNEVHSQRLAQELRTAASTAELSLRQLLTGVDNLRMMASTLENMHRIEEKPDRFSNFDDRTGPAL